jgi:hypothetical protein
MCTATIRNNSNKKQLSYWRNLCFEHYVYLIKTQRIICTKMPMAVRRWFQNCSNMVPTRMTQVEIYGTLAASSEATQLVEALSLTQSIHTTWAAFFYELNVAFNVTRHPTFVATMKATSIAGFDYTPPMYHAMQTKHIEPKVKQIKAEMKKATKQSTVLYGATICSNSWDNVIHWLLMNVMLVCPTGDVFIDSVDTTGHKKTKEYIVGALVRIGNEVWTPSPSTWITTNLL